MSKSGATTAQPQVNQAKHVKKMMTRIIIGKTPNAKMLPDGDDATLPLYNVMGIARGVKSGESNFGPWNCLTGDFYAVTVDGKEEFRSTKVFLPEVAELPLLNALSESKDGVKFAFTVGIKAAKTQIGYEYYVSALMPARESDALADLKNQVMPLLTNQAAAPAALPNQAAPAGKGKGAGK